jgi:hypothetical protein
MLIEYLRKQEVLPIVDTDVGLVGTYWCFRVIFCLHLQGTTPKTNFDIYGHILETRYLEAGSDTRLILKFSLWK